MNRMMILNVERLQIWCFYDDQLTRVGAGKAMIVDMIDDDKEDGCDVMC
jgi:hypothetical protein